MSRLLGWLALITLLWWAPSATMKNASAAAPPPTSLDCDAMPCRYVLPAGESFRSVAESPYWEGLDADGNVVGWVAMSTDYVAIKAYSGKPLVTLVGLSPDGVVTGARVVHHSEPILLVGIPEQALHDFADFYSGRPALERVVVGRSKDKDVVSVDAISGATVTVLAQNQTILETARALGATVGVFSFAAVSRGHFVVDAQPMSFAQMLERKAIGRLVVSASEMGLEESGAQYMDLYFAIIDAPQVGRTLVGEREYEFQMSRLSDGEHLLAVFNAGSGSFKGSAFVRGGVFDRVRIQQGLREITFRDTDYSNVPGSPAEDAPEFNEGAIFVLRDGRFDPGEPYEMVFLGSRYDQRGAFTRDFREFSSVHQLPKSIYVVDRNINEIPWRQAWLNRRVETAVLVVYLVLVTAVFVARRYTTADPHRIERLHLASLIFAFAGVGVWMRAQPSVTQILTLMDSLVNEWRQSLFLSEPMIFVSWVFIAIVSLWWGRGVFCGWVCPYGAMTELVFKVGQKFGIERFELSDRVHLKLRYLRYGVLVLLLSVFLFDSILAERMAEVEPFKSTFLVPFWNRHWAFGVWWVVLLVSSLFMFRPFCRYVCPLGGGLALISSFRPSGPRRRVFCSSCTICTRGCEPRAFRSDGSIDPRECLSCMDCEAVYRNESACPPLMGIKKLEVLPTLSTRQRDKLEQLRREAVDL